MPRRHCHFNFALVDEISITATIVKGGDVTLEWQIIAITVIAEIMTFEHAVAERWYQTLAPLAEELAFSANTNYLFDLSSYLGVISVLGERGHEFLQGQLTCDVRQINADNMRQGALCNLKGRVLALLDVINWGDYQLILPQDLINDSISSFSTAAMLSRVKLQHTTNLKIFGLYHNALSSAPTAYHVVSNEHYCSYAISNDLSIYLVKPDYVDEFMQQMKQVAIKGSLAWHYIQLQHQRVSIYPATRGLFLPHRLNLPELGYISFDKGCYKGQEIVARTQYRSKPKHHLQNFIIRTEQTLQLGSRLCDANSGNEAGELIDYCPMADNHYLIATSIVFDHPKHIKFEGGAETISLHLT